MQPSQDITIEELRRILRLASRAPSAGNGQPWSFEWTGDRLKLFFDPKRRPPIFDPHGRGTWLQVGIFLECLDIAASANGFAIHPELHMPYVDGNSPATVRFTRTQASASPYADTLAIRYTDRRPYGGGSVDAPVFNRVTAEFTTPHSAIYHSPVTEELVDHIADCDRLFHTWPLLHGDTKALHRWTPEETARTRDGVFYAASGLSTPMAKVFKVLYDNPSWIEALDERGLLKKLVDRRFRRNVTSAAGFSLVTLRNPTDYEGLVPTGRLMMRAWLMSQHAGYSTHVYGPCCLLIWFKAVGGLSEEALAKVSHLIDRGDELFRRQFKYSNDETPLLLWRVGLTTSPLPAQMLTLRRNIDDMLRVATS